MTREIALLNTFHPVSRHPPSKKLLDIFKISLSARLHLPIGACRLLQRCFTMLLAQMPTRLLQQPKHLRNSPSLCRNTSLLHLPIALLIRTTVRNRLVCPLQL